MNISRKKTGQEITLNLSGKLDQEAAPMLGNAVREASCDSSTIVLNCTDLTGITACGLRELIISRIIMQDHGGRLQISGCKPELQHFFRATGSSEMLAVQA